MIERTGMVCRVPEDHMRQVKENVTCGILFDFSVDLSNQYSIRAYDNKQ